jgi:hypothetical protein
MVTNVARRAVSEYMQMNGDKDQETRKAAVFWCVTPCSVVQILTMSSNVIMVKSTFFSSTLVRFYQTRRRHRTLTHCGPGI